MTILSRSRWAGKGARTGLLQVKRRTAVVSLITHRLVDLLLPKTADRTLSCRTSGGGEPWILLLYLVEPDASPTIPRANNRRTWPIIDEEGLPRPSRMSYPGPEARVCHPLLR